MFTRVKHANQLRQRVNYESRMFYKIETSKCKWNGFSTKVDFFDLNGSDYFCLLLPSVYDDKRLI
jgi:hypothetical protein